MKLDCTHTDVHRIENGDTVKMMTQILVATFVWWSDVIEHVLSCRPPIRSTYVRGENKKTSPPGLYEPKRFCPKASQPAFDRPSFQCVVSFKKKV